MRELDLLEDYLVKLRQEKLELAHKQALASDPDLGRHLFYIRLSAHEAELCTRIREAVKILTKDPGQFIREFLT